MPPAIDQSERNLRELVSLKREFQLDNAELAELCEYSAHYVERWLAAADATRRCPIPDRAMTIIRLKLENPTLREELLNRKLPDLSVG